MILAQLFDKTSYLYNLTRVKSYGRLVKDKQVDRFEQEFQYCLLYTSDAADELDGVGVGGGGVS